jgi:aconitate hydratase
MPSDRATRTRFELDLSDVEPSLAGPKRPQDRIALSAMKDNWRRDRVETFGEAAIGPPGQQARIAPCEAMAPEQCVRSDHGAVVIAAITSCTNTSNPDVLVAAGLVARKANELGLKSKPWVKTSLAPGSKVVTDYLDQAGLTPHLDALGFHTVGYGCTTCIGNSGPLPEAIDAGHQGRRPRPSRRCSPATATSRAACTRP